MLTAEHVLAWRTAGAVLVHDFLDVTEAARVMAREYATTTHDFGNNDRLEFPCRRAALDAVPVHPRLLGAAAALLGCSHVALHQAVAWTKHGQTRGGAARRNNNQRLHQGFANHTWVVPPGWDTPDAVAAIVYYSDVCVTGGATAVVPRRQGYDPLYTPTAALRMPGVAGIPFENDKDAAEQIMQEYDPDMHRIRQEAYTREVLMDDARPGSVLFYRLDAWHRGTPVRPGRARHVHSLAWKRLGDNHVLPHNWGRCFERGLYQGWLEAWVSRLSPLQLIAIGFPPPWSSYWTAATARHVQRRYPRLDVAAYVGAARSKL